MKRAPVCFLIITCFFTSPNCGVLFASTPTGVVANHSFSERTRYGLEAVKGPDAKIVESSQKLKRARLLKRALFAVDFQDAPAFSLLIFCFVLPFLFVAVSRRLSQTLPRSPPLS